MRASLARAFVNDPEVLLMDEPFAALDAQNKVLLQEELLKIWERNRKTVVYITHSIDEALLRGDRVVIMTGVPGRIKDILDVDFERPRDVVETKARRDPRSCRPTSGACSSPRCAGPGRRDACAIRSHKGERVKRSGMAVVVALLLALTPWAASAQAPAVLKVGTIGIMADVGLFLAIERGYFTERGLKVELVPISSAGDVMAMLATNQLELVGGGFSIPLFNAINRGMPIRAVVARGLLIPGYDNNVVLVRPDLADVIKTPRDLKGRKLAVNSPVSPLVYVLGKMMESVGLTLRDLDLVTMPFPSMATALTTKAIDAAISVEPFVTLMHEKGTAVRWKGTADFVTDPYMHISTYLVNHEWAEKNAKVTTDFLVAYIKGLRAYYDVLLTGKGREELVNVFVRYTSVKDRPLYDRMTWQFIDPNGYIGRRSVEDQITWYATHGMITKKLGVDQVVDLRYLEAALKTLGTIPCPKCAQ